MRQQTRKVEFLDIFAVRRIAVQNQVLRLARKLLEGRVQIELVGRSGQSHGALQVGGTRTGAEAAFKQRLGPIDDDLGGIEIVFRAEPVALLASAVGRIETERTRLELRNRNPAIGTGKFFGVDVLFAAHADNGDQTSSKLQRG